MSVNFYENIDDELLKFAVIVSKTNGKWVFCKHKQRNTLEVPGGHREPNENIIDTARRELVEETGAVDFDLKPICVYSVVDENNFNGEETFGLLCYADIYSFGEIDSEIEKIVITDVLPENWMYPDIQPILMTELKKRSIV
ncbi:MAG: NUDIX domain-containing protein [Eubacterium sp.]